MSTHAPRPWWIDGGSETCTACAHFYAYEMEFRCVACDGGICCHCVRFDMATGEARCPACETAEKEA